MHTAHSLWAYCWLTARIPENPLQVRYCSGSGTCNRSEIHFSFLRFSLTLHHLSVSSCNSSLCSELLTTVRSLPRPRLRCLCVHRLQQRYFFLFYSLAKMKTWPTLSFILKRIEQSSSCHMLSNTTCAENSELIMSLIGFMQFNFIICGFLCDFQGKIQLPCVLCTCMLEILETIQICKHVKYPVLDTIWTCFIKMKFVVLNCWTDFLFMNVQRRTLSQHPAALSYIHTCLELSHSVVESVKPEYRFSLKVYVDGDLELHQKSKQVSLISECIDWPACASKTALSNCFCSYQWLLQHHR